MAGWSKGLIGFGNFRVGSQGLSVKGAKFVGSYCGCYAWAENATFPRMSVFGNKSSWSLGLGRSQLDFLGMISDSIVPHLHCHFSWHCLAAECLLRSLQSWHWADPSWAAKQTEPCLDRGTTASLECVSVSHLFFPSQFNYETDSSWTSVPPAHHPNSMCWFENRQC